MSLITRMEWPYQSLNHPNQKILHCPAVAEVVGLNPTKRTILGAKCPGASDRVGASITICNLKYFNWDGWLCFNPGPRSLSPAHDNGVVYQEIKPQNILLAEDEIVKV